MTTNGEEPSWLVDHRREEGNIVAPTQFYAACQRELAIAAVSAYQTLTQHIHILVDLLDRGRKLCVLLLDPEADDVPLIVQRERHPGVVYGTLHEGPILHFAKVEGGGGFDYFGVICARNGVPLVSVLTSSPRSSAWVEAFDAGTPSSAGPRMGAATT